MPILRRCNCSYTGGKEGSIWAEHTGRGTLNFFPVANTLSCLGVLETFRFERPAGSLKLNLRLVSFLTVLMAMENSTPLARVLFRQVQRVSRNSPRFVRGLFAFPGLRFQGPLRRLSDSRLSDQSNKGHSR